MTDELSKIDVSSLQLLNGIEHGENVQQSRDTRALHRRGYPHLETRLETAAKVHRHNRAPGETFDAPDTSFNHIYRDLVGPVSSFLYRSFQVIPITHSNTESVILELLRN